ncbi:hypothetical protein Aduo_015808 [Ancylostoma duodenale]
MNDSQLPSGLNQCHNRDCPRQRMHAKRYRAVRNICVATVDVTSQLAHVLTNNIDEVAHAYTVVHNRRYMPQFLDSRGLPDFQANIESYSDFLRHRLKVQLILNSDGFVYKTLQRGSTWPTYAALWDIKPSVRHKRENAIVIAVVCGGNSISDEMWEHMLGRFRAFLDLNARQPPKIRSKHGSTFEVVVCVSRVDMDMDLGNPNLMEMKQIYTHTRSAELRSQIELVAGSGLLFVHRSLCQEHLEGDVTGIHRLVRHQHLEPSSFGEAGPTMSFSYVASDENFRSINFVDEYGNRKLPLGQHLSGDTKIRQLKQMLKKVVINPNDFHKLTVRVRDGHDGLISLPLPFRATLKGFILLHTAQREGDSAFAIALDAMISSMVKEARRPPERQQRRRCDTVTGVANDEESVEP